MSERGITIAAISSSIHVGRYSPGVRIVTGPREEFPTSKHRRPEANAWEAEERWMAGEKTRRDPGLTHTQG